MTQTVAAKLKYLRIAPRKTRFIADVIRGLPVSEAEAQLLLSPRRASDAILKLLRSAVADAKNNHQLELSKLYVREIKVDQGPKSKRFAPRAFGRVNLIEKKTSHVTLILGVSDKLTEPRFVIQESRKKEKTKISKEQEKKEQQEKPSVKDGTVPTGKEKQVPEVKPTAKPGFFKKVFRRKSI
ncbi:MAG: 50S ribosomal protein L22 [Patescibacteria group bacterium]|nr:50S ribosomal protein L22 [Patescibacteria group bacterium]